MLRLFVCLSLCASMCGCMESLENQTKKSPNSIIGKTTQEVGEFDPAAGKTVSDSKVRATDPVLAGVQAYGPIVEQTVKLRIQADLNIFHATNDRYPRDHKEFMDEIITAGGIKLPVLPGGSKYEYDVQNHELVVVKASPEGN